MYRRSRARTITGVFLVLLSFVALTRARQQPTFRGGVEVVLIDVNVVDAHSKPVATLKPEDFIVTVDRRARNMEDADAEITVTYAPSADLGGLWVPTEVREAYTSDTQKLEAVARYVNFRVVKVK